jgi:hypothetical protein
VDHVGNEDEMMGGFRRWMDHGCRMFEKRTVGKRRMGALREWKGNRHKQTQQSTETGCRQEGVIFRTACGRYFTLLHYSHSEREHQVENAASASAAALKHRIKTADIT